MESTYGVAWNLVTRLATPSAVTSDDGIKSKAAPAEADQKRTCVKAGEVDAVSCPPSHSPTCTPQNPPRTGPNPERACTCRSCTTTPISLPTTTVSSTVSASSTTTTTTASRTPPAVSGLAYQGCYLDSADTRTLGFFVGANGNTMTPTLCSSLCTSSGYAYAGIEYGDEVSRLQSCRMHPC
jgi:hypothetical protein